MKKQLLIFSASLFLLLGSIRASEPTNVPSLKDWCTNSIIKNNLSLKRLPVELAHPIKCIKLKAALKKPIKNYCKKQHNELYTLHKSIDKSLRNKLTFSLFTRCRMQLALRDKTNDRTHTYANDTKCTIFETTTPDGSHIHMVPTDAPSFDTFFESLPEKTVYSSKDALTWILRDRKKEVYVMYTVFPDKDSIPLLELRPYEALNEIAELDAMAEENINNNNN